MDSLSYPIAHFQIAEAYQYSGDLRRARTEYLLALKLDPDYISARLNLGITFLEERNWKRALGEFDTILSAKPSDIAALTNKAITLFNAGRKKEAILIEKKILELDPSNAQAKDFLRDLGVGHR
jgi:tetratricopeptide (TPR) repeat protein